MAAREQFGHGGAPVAAMRGELRIAQLVSHQRVPLMAESEESAFRGARSGKSISRETRHYDVERVGLIAAVRCRISQQWDELEKTIERVGETVGQDDRQRRGTPSLLVDEMNACAIDSRRE